MTGSGPNQLNVPVFALQLPNRNILVVDQGNNRVIEIARHSKQIVFEYGGNGVLNKRMPVPNTRDRHPFYAKVASIVCES